MNSTMISESVGVIDKVKRYKWTFKDEPGTMRVIHKDLLMMAEEYQRGVVKGKLTEITANWSWIAAGVIVVGARNGEYWVIDGQHRVLAAKRRSDIVHLPCIVFETVDVKQEAVGFLNLNTQRKPVSSVDKYRAMLTAGDKAAMQAKAIFDSLGVTVKRTAQKPGEIKGVEWVVKKAGENPDKLRLVMSVAVAINTEKELSRKLLDGLWYIHERVPGGIGEKKLRARLSAVGERKLIDGANKAAAFFTTGGAKVWATGMMEEINRGLRSRYTLNAEPAQEDQE